MLSTYASPSVYEKCIACMRKSLIDNATMLRTNSDRVICFINVRN